MQTCAMSAITITQPKKGSFVPKNFQLTTWSELEPYFEELLHRNISSTEELEQWIVDKNQLDMAVGEAMSWRYIRITVNSADQDAAEAYNYAVEHLAPQITAYENHLDGKLFIDRLSPIKSTRVKAKIKKFGYPDPNAEDSEDNDDSNSDHQL